MTRLIATAAALVLAVPLIGCDDLFTGPDHAASSRILLSSDNASTFSASVLADFVASDVNGDVNAKPGNGPIDLATIEHINVQITGVSLLATDSRGWRDADLDYDPDTTWFDLRSLSDITTLGTVPADLEGDLVALRLEFGDADVVFTDGQVEPLFIPSGKVAISTRDLGIDLASDLALVFQTDASVRKVIRTGNGLLMPPVFTINGAGDNGSDEDEDEDEDDEDDEEDGD